MTTLTFYRTAPVESVMTSRVVMVLEQIPMAEVRAIATRYDYNGFPVVTREGRLVGVVTKGDLLRVLKAGLGDPAVWREPVSRWMAHGVLALRAKDSVETAVSLMGSGHEAQKPTAHMPKIAMTEAEARALAAWLASLH